MSQPVPDRPVRPNAPPESPLAGPGDGLTHFDAGGNAVMVDVSDKAETDRCAVARGVVEMAPATLRLIEARGLAKGDVLAVAQLAGIMGAKRTPDLIPLCHPLPLTKVAVDLRPDPGHSRVVITATCRLRGRTGVEMEALTAVSVAALTLVDMCKAVDKGLRITGLQVIEKRGGRSGSWSLATDPDLPPPAGPMMAR